tara:strand:+ start:188 stop:370 length:183 start_codon:yes stop_codon:yes gene_type:complete
MIKKINIIIVTVLLSYIIISKLFFSMEVNPCDITCDNCMDPQQCEECYKGCYESEDTQEL